jgi:hypothetical protein
MQRPDQTGSFRDRHDGPTLGPVLAVWAMYGAVGTAIFVTYARLPPDVFYNVSRDGLAGGAGRALVFVNYPVALVAPALLGVATERLLTDPGASPRRRRTVAAGAATSVLLCLAIVVPGVVDEADLDAKPINAVPALGVALALGLTAFAARATGLGRAMPRERRDTVALVAAGGLLLLALPWVLAELGVYVDDVPLLGRVFVGKEYLPPGADLRAVHLGHHHGLDGVLFALTALALSRDLGRVRSPALRRALGWFLALMLTYGLANAANDFWLEQVVKRGWTGRELPDVLRPAFTLGWGAILLATPLAYRLLRRRSAPSEGTVAPKPASR